MGGSRPTAAGLGTTQRYRAGYYMKTTDNFGQLTFRHQVGLILAKSEDTANEQWKSCVWVSTQESLEIFLS